MAGIVGIHRLSLAVPKVEQSGVFYRDLWGMELLQHNNDRWKFKSHAVDHCDLSLLPASTESGLASLALSVPGEVDLDPLVSAALKAGGRLVHEPRRSDEYPGEISASISDIDGNTIELVFQAEPSHKPDLVSSKPGPHKIGHVVLWTPQIEAMEAFYAVLGARVTDRTAMGMSFLRCNADHHSIALAQSKGRIGLQHIAFDVVTIDEVMRAKGRLMAAGVECIWGPGRHGPGNNIFSYYQDPAGNIIEFYGDMEQVNAEGEQKEPVWWGPEHGGDIWGVAGPAPQSFRP